MKKHNCFKKILSLLLVFSLVIGMIPVTAFATENMVYISVSYDDKYIVDKDGKYIAKVGVPISEIAAIDLEAYGLGDYLYDQDGDGEYETTALQLVIYAHENIYGGEWSDVIFTGAPGSSYFAGGIFGFDENLNYFLNGEYPLLYDGWGATSDQIVLYAGDFLDIGSFSSWDFYSDSNYGFHFFANENDELYHEYTVESGKDLTVKLMRSYSGMGVGAMLFEEADYNVSYGTAYNKVTGTKTTDSSGQVTFNFKNAGTYYIWADGGYGMEFPESIVSTPAFAKVIVTEPQGPSQEEIDKAAADSVIAKINSIGKVALESENIITAARIAYNNLTADQKTLVTNYGTLTAAETELSKLKANKAAADSVIAAINSIGKVTLGSESTIVAARTAYNNLTAEQKVLVENYTTLTAAESQLSKLKADKAAANNVIAKINSIGKVTLGSESAIAVARTAYNNLTAEQRVLVDNYATLTAAEKELAELKADKAAADDVIAKINTIGEVTLASENKITAARNAYKGLTTTQKELVTNYNTLVVAEQELAKKKADKAAADEVITKIDVIGTVTLESENKITAAREAYKGLTAVQKSLVTNYKVLTAAEQELAKLKADKAAAENVIAKIDAIGEVTIGSTIAIATARAEYDGLTAAQKALVTNYNVLTKAETKLDQLVEDAEEAEKNKVAADTVIAKIDAIGVVALESEAKVIAAREAYEALTDEQKALVTNENVLAEAEQELVNIKEDKVIADGVVAKIEAIGSVTLESENKVTAAREAYDALTDAQKRYVTNYEVLTEAEVLFKELAIEAEKAAQDKAATDDVIAKIEDIGEVTLESEDLIEVAREAYDNLTIVQKALVTNYAILTEAEEQYAKLVADEEKAAQDKAAADDAIAKIESIGEVTLESKDTIEMAREAYDALTAIQKERVTNYQVLTDAEEQFEVVLEEAEKAAEDKVAADDIIAKIEAIGEVTLESEDPIEAIREAYDALTDAQKELVTNYSVLTEAEEELKKLQDEESEAINKVEADKAAAAEVDSLIDGIGDVSIYSVKKVYAAREAYDNLTSVQKTYVKNLNTLVKAEQALVEMYKEASSINHKDIYEKTYDYISGLGTPTVGSTGGEWLVIDFTRAGHECPEGYYENVEEFVIANTNDKEQLHRSKSTENSRVILALTSAGYDVTDVARHNLLMGLTDMDYVKKQGINGPIWALIALDSYDYEIPLNQDANEQVTREGLIEYILDKRVDDGGWNLILSAKVSDPDMTGMAIQALAPYYDTNPEVKEAIDGALETLSNIQHENGGFSSTDGICSESCAQVIVALTTLGINPETDARFIKNGVSVVDAMCLFAMEDGGFAHIPYAGLNGMATEQCQYALAAYYRFLDGKTSLYDMSDVQLLEDEEGTDVDGTKPSDKVEDDINGDFDNNDDSQMSPNVGNEGTNPNTGDERNLFVWISLMLVGLTGIVMFRRKNN